ncbi:MAG: hypothetical protein IT298_17390 [Chloroflexi bacterium]|nr:hypothetical protein [Chloroflexota bacterium]RIK20117.1 MAG: hypothetical protein DCC53_11530 [Chloroflexota bacterium]
MNDDELRQLIGTIVNSLQQRGLNWILQQVVESLIDEDSSDLSTDALSGVLARLPDQRLVLLHLLDGLEYGIIHQIAITEGVSQFFRSRGFSYTVNGTGSVEPNSLISNQTSLPRAVERAIQLENTIAQIRQQLDDVQT